ncbi:MAG: pilus assembly protein [Luteibacter sp.]|jgi:type IV pilus assembly protein PilX|uniref:pilus assembly PilX family protein n=1 Tax=Rhodanobacteraceae TaxID=1775411 RepID=UPI0005BBCF8F|nr:MULTISPECIES: PilX N-terminal domain-containing pilus assembly protein [Rhodanobacteraceae]MDQ7995050.1 pilus assembly protein [Luteibacter sp.]MDQ8047434.1 pilus assembly protein [Luteibacter sp.]SDF48993.1 type IV pilus assembly protein PilX [Dyella sp. 333MFSha]SKB25619.1 type IV pilus assembly protein PilX [Luteibacter sp. 22Crub2.1]
MNRQRGAVLVLAMIFLLILTIVAISTSSRSLLQERMAGAMRNAQQAEWSAENALRGVEWNLFSGNAAVACYNSSNPSTISAKVTAFRQSSVWMVDGATEYKGAGVTIDYTKKSSDAALSTAVMARNPWYVVEFLGQDLAPGNGTSAAKEAGSSGSATAKFYLYRITARATGSSPNTIRVVETTFVTPNLVTCTLT